MSDFIREVDEEYRRDRVMQFLQRYQLLIAFVVVAVIVGAGGWRFWTDHKVAVAEKLNDRFMAATDLARQGKIADAQAAFAGLAKDGPAGYALLSRMRGAELLATKDPDAGAKAFDDIASDTAVPAPMQDVARYRGALIRIDHDDPKAFEQRYGRFAAPGGGFANSMRELLALAAFKRQDFTAAARYLDEIIIDGGAPAALRGRAQAFRALVGAGAATTTTQQPPPANIEPLGGAKPPPPPAAPAPAPVVPTPPAPSPATPPTATAAPTPPAATPAAPPAPAPKPATGGAPD